MKYFKLPLAIATVVFLNCTKAYLDKGPLGELDEIALANKKGVEGLLIGAYSLLDGNGSKNSGYGSAASNWIYGSICGSEAYKGGGGREDQKDIAPLETFSATASNFFLPMKWGTLYDGIQRSNDVLRIMRKAKDISPADQERIAAEARFLRAYYHFEAKKMWNNIPFIDETITYENGNYHISNRKDAWPEIENDLKYAVNNLKDPDPATPGRANKYTARALLAKAYMFQKKFAEAKPLLEVIISSGIYELVNYHDNFNPETKKNKESILSAQVSVNDGSEGQNGNIGDVLNFPNGGGPGGCCGFFSPSQWLVNHFKTEAVTGLPDLDHYNDVNLKFDSALASTDPFIPYDSTLDSRLDWTVGRRGIPYLDWGIHPGLAWIRDQDQNLNGPYSPKKNVFSKSQEPTLTEQVWSNISANNINLIRYADVLLWAAETEIETGDLEKARGYVNDVRARAADSSGWVKKANGTPAANYKVGLYPSPWADKVFALKAVRYERILELAMEGHRFFDLVRWGIAEIEINSYLQDEKILRSYLNTARFTKNKNEYFPIPQKQIDLSADEDGVQQMIQNPGY